MIDSARIWAHLDGLAKPRRSLGRLEATAVRLATIQRTLKPITRPRRLVLFAADHGVVARGVSAWPSEVTGLMVSTIIAGRASSSALAAAHGCSLRLVDMGVASSLPSSPPDFFRNARIAPGTQDLSEAPAMTPAQFDAAWDVGANEASRAINEGNTVLIAGEMGIGNTTSAACITTLLADVPVEGAVGRGAGADDVTVQTKRNVVTVAVDRVRATFGKQVHGRSTFGAPAGIAEIREARPANGGAYGGANGGAHGRSTSAGTHERAGLATTAPAGSSESRNLRDALATVAGFEIVAMAGFYAAGAQQGATLLLDGYVATSAALIAERLQPGTVSSMIAGHRSAEPGHGGALARLQLEPLLDWGMRLGEGTGALVALPLLDSAAALLRDVAALSELGVSRED